MLPQARRQAAEPFREHSARGDTRGRVCVPPDERCGHAGGVRAGPDPDLLGFVGMQIEMTGLTGRKVQLHTAPMLSLYFRHEVLKEARMLHAA